MSKNAIKLLLVLVLVLAMVAGCSSTKVEEPTVEEPTDQPVVEEPVVEEPVVEAPLINIGLVTDIGGIDDKSFNQGTWEGIVRFAEDNNLTEDEYKYIQSESDADYLPNLATFSDEEMDLIVAPGFLFFDSMTEVANLYPDQKYLLLTYI